MEHNQTDLVWSNEKRKVSDLVGMEINSRVRELSKKQKYQLEQSFKKFNYVEVIAINKDNTILAGHQRAMMLKLLGRENEEIDVRVPNRLLNVDEAKEYSLRSNKNTADWDYEALVKEFEAKYLVDIGFKQEDLKKASGDDGFLENDERVVDLEPEPFEHWDYLVVVADNQHDWLFLEQFFNIRKVRVGTGVKKIGKGRVIKASEAIRKINESSGV